MDSLIPIVIIAVLILLNGVFVAAEFAIAGVSRASIDHRAAGGHPVAQAVSKILRNPRNQDRYIATAQLGITAASLGLGMYGEHTLAVWIGGWLEGLGSGGFIASHVIATVLAVTVLTYFHIVIGEMVPKALALQQAERTALWVTPPMVWLGRIFYPIVAGLNAIGNAVLRLMQIRREFGSEQLHTSDELRVIVEESTEGGLLAKESGQVLQDLLEFGGRIAEEVMVPRVRIAGLPVGATPDQIAAIIRTSPHTTYPVFEGSLDNVRGAIHVRQLLRLLRTAAPLTTGDLHNVPFLPSVVRIEKVIAAIRQAGSRMVIVIDEYGGTAGLITVEDLFEEVVGEVEEERGPSPPVRRDESGALFVSGTLRLDELGEAVGRVIEHDLVESVGGLILALLERPARAGDAVTYQGLHLEVIGVRGLSIQEVRVNLAGPEE